MRKFLPILGAIITSCLFGFGQTPEKLSCPTVIVNGPSGIVDPGQTANFTVTVVGKGETSALEYFWVVEPKRNFAGQGTVTIRVEYPNYEVITAAATIKGLPVGCPATASETYIIDVAPKHRRIGEISNLRYVVDKKLIKSIAWGLQEQPNAMLYIVMQFRYGTTAKVMELSRKRLADHLNKSKIDSERTRFVVTENGNGEFTFWLVPQGSPIPYVDK